MWLIEKISYAPNPFVLMCFYKFWTIDFRSILLLGSQVRSIVRVLGSIVRWASSYVR
jgi:hypothetical protein